MREQIEAEIGPVDQFAKSIDANQPASSPGQQAIHYAPRTPTYHFEQAEVKETAQWMRTKEAIKVAGIFIGELSESLRGMSFGYVANLSTRPAGICPASLRDAARGGSERGINDLVGDASRCAAWAAVHDRLMRASVEWKRT